MRVIAIDPGTTHSGVILMDCLDEQPLFKEHMKNTELITWLKEQSQIDVLLLEWIESYGMAVGRETFETCHFIGKLALTAKLHGIPEIYHVGRKSIKMHHCNSTRAKDANIRQSLIDKYGLPGTKKAQGVTYGISGHIWPAYALATYYFERTQINQPIENTPLI